MSKPLTKTDLKLLAKYIVDETKLYNDKDTKIRLEKENKKKEERLNKLLQDEDSKIHYIEEFITEIMDQDEEVIDIDYLSPLHIALFNKIKDLEVIVNDMNKETKNYTKKLYEKYTYIINQKLIDLGY
jgi:hypothetical protein